MAYTEGTVLKHKYAWYAKITSTDTFVQINKGFTDFTGTLNPTTDTTQYIGESTKTQTTTAYEPALSFTAERYCGDDFNDYLYECARDQVLNAQVYQIVRVDLTDPTGTTNEYNAVAAKYNVSIDNYDTGAPGEKTGFSGSLTQEGGTFVSGTFNISTKAFTQAQ